MKNSWIFWMIGLFIIFLLSLGSVAFITLMERKTLGLSQVRLGPNKTTIFGVVQPVFDGVKLLIKFLMTPLTAQLLLMLISPALMLTLFVVLWGVLLAWEGQEFSIKLSSLVFFAALSAGAYSVIMTGWSSTSGYSKLGSIRGMLQSLSFEVVLIMFFMFLLSILKSFHLMMKMSPSSDLFLLWVSMWIILSLMEGNRAPFDLLEGESELISGFNVEMASLTFVYLFLSEYGMMMVMSVVAVMMVGGSPIYMVVLALALLFIRSCYPRIRYDSLMEFMWQSFLPMITGIYVLAIFL